ncbi:hypothetical protein TRIATDRAFT_301534 [Trichoderma atroviride IMI 206040]|uniref:Uncharacterized protein n=1 Tax=Hypocrea atroviridis (strain ATCC 20476 / IMI 206040) TaxID=452589 RepID=G9P766_HYPAI|nr:uncharacterized protein TRIATDRAFT_301534 [Trichoderma atroviride IMI 206040]EHK40738.1 hypothetical protein TRIATDRAFT_301534 [Trichoderma atroviride IMI 206040]
MAALRWAVSLFERLAGNVTKGSRRRWPAAGCIHSRGIFSLWELQIADCTKMVSQPPFLLPIEVICMKSNTSIRTFDVLLVLLSPHYRYSQGPNVYERTYSTHYNTRFLKSYMFF